MDWTWFREDEVRWNKMSLALELGVNPSCIATDSILPGEVFDTLEPLTLAAVLYLHEIRMYGVRSTQYRESVVAQIGVALEGLQSLDIIRSYFLK